jgi:uncharacterized protein (TIGR03118 family)
MRVFAGTLMMLIITMMAVPQPAHGWGAGDDGREDEGREGAYALTPLVSDTGAHSAFTDPNLVNGWGLVFNPTGAVWLADNGSGKSTLYLGTGAPLPLVVTVPAAPSSGSVSGTPTGIAYNGSTEFVVSKTVPATATSPSTTLSGPAVFLYGTEDGIIAGWAPTVDLANARLAVDDSAAHAVYKGIAIAGNGTTFVLYAADFHNRRVAVFDGAFKPLVKPGAFEDGDLPADYAPFGIANINGDIYVTYARQDAARHDELDGAGAGFVDVYDADGKLISRLVTRGALNAPWGMALAPASFGRFGGALLVGNFGDGAINAYDPRTGRHLGKLRDAKGHALAIDGLWGLAFGNGVDAQPADTLFYAAGPGGEAHGAYGAIRAMRPADDH